MFNYPYQTRPCEKHPIGDIVTGLQEAFINGDLVEVKTNKDRPIEGLYQVPPYLKSIPHFGHPMWVKTSDRTIVVIDTRAFTRADRSDNSLKVAIPGEYDQLSMYGRLSMAWNQDMYSDLCSISDLVPRVFMNLISQNIVRRLGLNPQDQQYLSVLSTYYYFCLCQQQDKLNEQELLRMATRISRVTSISGQDVLRVLSQLNPHQNNETAVIANIEQFVDAIKQVGDSARLNSLNVGLLYSAIGTAWFGANAAEYVAASLEYPPLFITLVYRALVDRGYRNTTLSRFVELSNKRDMGSEFIRNLSNFLENTAPSGVMAHA